ncbi:MAG: TonB-dependent receptor, partial [Blastocatellia bacterium]|nr:TonB-dependent receptor [Blastocatellia bacterium]
EPAVDFSRFYFGQSYTFNFKVGFSFINRDREFTARRFRFFPRSFDGIDRTSRPELFYSSQNIRPDGLELFEDTRPTDFYVALQNLTAGYVMGDFTLRKFRFIGGVRFENSEQEVRTENLFVPGASPVVANLDNTDALPSFGLVYNLTPDINIRTGYSQTVSRPQFRELSPFEFSDFTGGRATLGNPNLKRALIRNFDVRFEKFQKDGGLLAASFFYKKFDNPIEIVVEATTSLRTSFRNAQGATNKGFELEGRQSLGRLSQKLQNLSINGNYSFVSSNIQIGDQDLSVLTSRERPLNGQSRHLVNMTLNYDIPQYKADARVLFNYTGARITDVGTFGLPDIFEKGYPTLDLFFSKRFGGDTNKFELKVTGENMLNRLVRFKQNDLPFLVYRKGRNISFGISYSFF